MGGKLELSLSTLDGFGLRGVKKEVRRALGDSLDFEVFGED